MFVDSAGPAVMPGTVWTAAIGAEPVVVDRMALRSTALAADETVDTAGPAVGEAAGVVGRGRDPIISVRIEPNPCVIGVPPVRSVEIPVAPISERRSTPFGVVAFNSIKLSNLVFLTFGGLPDAHCFCRVRT